MAGNRRQAFRLSGAKWFYWQPSVVLAQRATRFRPNLDDCQNRRGGEIAIMASPLDALWNQCDRYCRSQNIEPTSHAWFMIGALCMASIIQQPETEKAVEEAYEHLKTFRDSVPFHGYMIPQIHAWNEA